MMRYFPLAALLIGTVLIAVAATGTSQANEHWRFKNPVEPEPSGRLSVGKKAYDAYCAECHGKTAGGTDQGPTFISRIYHPGHHADGSFVLAAKNGARAHHWRFGNMKKVEKVTDAQITTIIEYVRAVQKANGVY